MAKISVVVPVYNVEKYLKECIDSIINQTLEDIEIICVNDGSTDSSLEILNDYAKKDSRIIVINKSNSGYGHTMNMGLNAATGEYVGIIESDDFADKNMFEDLYKLAKEYDADIVKGDWYNYWSKNKFARKNNRISSAKALKLTNSKQDKSLLRINPSVWSAIYKKEFLNKYNIRFLETPGASYQDLAFSFKIFALAERVILTDKAYLYYRQDNMNSSVKSKTKVYCVCDEYEEIDRFLEQYPDLKFEFKVQEEINRYNGYVSSVLRIDDSVKPEFVKVFSDHFKEEYNTGLLGNEFFKKINKNEFMTLINNPEKYIKVLKSIEKRRKFNQFRKNILSIHFRNGKLNLTLFGKEVI
ncbi:glycosyltransferase group 2 family protein [Clostridium sp. CAG:768]|nr:glycosyltransferase group 2 family protein [Clostridium sp. CAG:768]